MPWSKGFGDFSSEPDPNRVTKVFGVDLKETTEG